MRNNHTLYILGLAVALVLGCTQPPAPARTIKVTMKKYAVLPAEIHLKQGETVQFEVVTADVQHGFTIKELGVNEPVNPGKPAVFSFTADRKGAFVIECGIICGFGHENMRARLIVE